MIQTHQNSVTSLSPELLHDLRTPLNHIIGYSELLTDQAQEEGQLGFMPDLQKIHAAGHQLLALLSKDTIPVAPAMVKTSSDTAADVPAQSPTQALVLVVDDNQVNRDVLARRLAQEGHAVTMAENGREAMEVARSEPVDLILLDIMMPEVDGYETLRQLKADEALRHIPVIMISAVDEIDSVVKCLEMGADDYMTKPFDPTLLKARTGACLAKKRGHDREVQLHDQLERNYSRLQELEGQRDGLTSMIVHDLRTPLGSLISGLQMVPAMGDLNAEQSEVMAIALSGGATLLRMINGLLDVEKMEAGAMKLDNTFLDAGELVSCAITQVSELAQAMEITLVRALDPDLPFFEGDEDKLVRTLVNILGNAIKFTPAGGTVTLAVQASGDHKSLLFSVSDTGEGIPEEALELVFDKFWQVSTRKNGRMTSSGLGLTFCKLAVEAHGGKIVAANGAEKGSVFSFDIPCKQMASIGV